MKEQLELWDTTATLANGSGLPVYGIMTLLDCIGFPMAFLVSRILGEGILVVAFFGRAEVHSVPRSGCLGIEKGCYSTGG